MSLGAINFFILSPKLVIIPKTFFYQKQNYFISEVLAIIALLYTCKTNQVKRNIKIAS